jgi:hypothetical protein
MRSHACLTVAAGLGCLTLVGCGNGPDGIAARIAAPPPTLAGASFSDWSVPASAGSLINGPFNDQQPALSKDGLTLFFQSNRPERAGDATLDGNVWVSQRACLDCPWEAPVLLGAPVNGPASDAAPNLSRDEHLLFFSSNRVASQGTDIFASYRDKVHDDLSWQEPVNLGPGVNTTATEAGASYFANEEGGRPQLFFHRQFVGGSNPLGHVYMSEQLPDGTWGTATPVDALNSAAADQRPSISHDGLQIYFWSTRDAGRGTPGSGYVWYSTRASLSDPWSPPVLADGPTAGRSAIQPFIYSHGPTETLLFVYNTNETGAVNLDIYTSTRTRGGRE